jgi:hypothetical protein
MWFNTSLCDKRILVYIYNFIYVFFSVCVSNQLNELFWNNGNPILKVFKLYKKIIKGREDEWPKGNKLSIEYSKKVCPGNKIKTMVRY